DRRILLEHGLRCLIDVTLKIGRFSQGTCGYSEPNAPVRTRVNEIHIESTLFVVPAQGGEGGGSYVRRAIRDPAVKQGLNLWNGHRRCSRGNFHICFLRDLDKAFVGKFPGKGSPNQGTHGRLVFVQTTLGQHFGGQQPVGPISGEVNTLDWEGAHVSRDRWHRGRNQKREPRGQNAKGSQNISGVEVEHCDVADENRVSSAFLPAILSLPVSCNQTFSLRPMRRNP